MRFSSVCNRGALHMPCHSLNDYYSVRAFSDKPPARMLNISLVQRSCNTGMKSSAHMRLAHRLTAKAGS
jgi:hypothetical protein